MDKREERKGLGLSERQAEVLKLLAEGYSQREISQKLFLSYQSIRVTLMYARSKLGAVNTTHAVATFVRGSGDDGNRRT